MNKKEKRFYQLSLRLISEVKEFNTYQSPYAITGTVYNIKKRRKKGKIIKKNTGTQLTELSEKIVCHPNKNFSTIDLQNQKSPKHHGWFLITVILPQD